MSDYRVERLSIEKIEGFARDFLADCCQYNKYTQTGWAVQAGKIVPLMLKMEG